MTVMETLWQSGEGNVHDIAGRLTRPLAYNTVMTTLDRLFKKGLLTRTKRDRAYFYSPSFSKLEWQQRQAEHLVADFLSRSGAASELLVSCLVDAVEQHDASLLDELEARVRERRKELEQAGLL